MKNFFLSIIAAFFFVSPMITKAQSETTTYYLIRHAEKDRSDASDRDPQLTDAGMARANKWAEVFSEVDFDAVYSTNYKRTQQTATPTAKAKQLEIREYDPRNPDISGWNTEHHGKSVLIVGHSNTTPSVVNKLIGKELYKEIDDHQNGYLFIVSVTGDVITHQVLVIN